jgi:hypothetical protein
VAGSFCAFLPAANAACNYSTATVLELGTKSRLERVTVFVTDDENNRDVTRSDDALYSLTIKDRSIPYALEFRKDGYQSMWKSNLACTGKLEELEITYMAATANLSKLPDDQLAVIVRNYRDALTFAQRHGEKDLESEVRKTIRSMAGLLDTSERRPPGVLQELNSLLKSSQ